jgi:hypothetical protein
MTFETAETAARWLGISQFIQVPVTAFLASEKGLGLASEFGKLPPLVSAIVRVLGASIVVTLVTLGGLIALYPADVLRTHFGSAVAGYLGALFIARLAVQVYYGRYWPARHRPWHLFMCLIFAVQGPGYLLLWAVSSP